MKVPALWFQVFGWLIASVSTGVGIYCVVQRETVVWVPTDGSTASFTSQMVGLEPVGLVLLGTGVLSLVALSIVETVRRR